MTESHFFDDSTILITGGAGSLGLELAKRILQFYEPRTLRLLDVSEYFLYKAHQELKDPRLRILLGDIRDKDRLTMAMSGVDYVIHTAAVKSVDIAAYNPVEAIKVNVDGTIALLTQAFLSKPKKFLFVSSDKAVFYERLNVYAATKFLGERMMTWANQIQDHTLYASFRSGNFYPSRMSVFENWNQQEAKGEPLTLTDSRMMRWFVPIHKAAEYVIEALGTMEGGEIFVAPGEERKILDLIAQRPYKVIGIREGERLREILMSPDEEKRAVKKGNLWVIR